jgi:hypothetical protein
MPAPGCHQDSQLLFSEEHAHDASNQLAPSIFVFMSLLFVALNRNRTMPLVTVYA